MSYRSDKEKMRKDVAEYHNKILFFTKITFCAFAACLIIFCAVLGLGKLFGLDNNDKKNDSGELTVSQNFNLQGFDTFDGGVVGYVGQVPTFKKFILIGEDAEITAIDHQVDSAAEGTYTVKYTVEDSNGNVAYFSLQYVVKKAEYSHELLMETIAELADELNITKNMTKVEQVRAIYKYVNSSSTVKFTDESNIPNIDRSKWESDWREEAVRGLESHEGDCYTYYSISKAFFEYFGIENVGIKRAENYEGAEDDGTHFWSIVNVGDGANAAWYYYDATRLNGYFNGDRSDNNACLITEAKLKTHKTSSGGTYFYKMVKPANFPKISTEELG
jgi:hypothetical protein